MEVTLCWSRGGVRRDFPLSEEGAAEMTCELTTVPICCGTEGGGEREFLAVNLSLRRGEDVFRI